MTDDLVERLRKAFWLREDDYDTAGGFRDTAPREAADRIEALEAENERLLRDRAALAKQLSIAERKLKSVTKLWHAATAALKGTEQ